MSESQTQLLPVLLEFAREHGPNFCTWDNENEKSNSSKLIHGENGVEGHHKLLGCLHKLTENLSFQRLMVLNVLQNIHTAMGEEKDPAIQEKWWLKDKHIEKWKTDMCARIRNMCRAISQGELKARGAKKKPSWLQSLPWHMDLEMSDDATTKTRKRSKTSDQSGSSASIKYRFDS